MKVGCCCGIESIEILEKLSINELELSASWIAGLDEQAFQKVKNTLDNSNVKVHVCNCLIPSDVVPLFEDEQLENTTNYLNRLLPRLSEIGVQYIVFGSGKFRNVPENTPESTVKRKITEFLNLLSRTAKTFNITIVIEPLNRRETNVLLNTAEAVEYIEALKNDNIKLLVDLYHFDLESEDLNNIVKYKHYIKHVHIAKPVMRCCPKQNDGYDYFNFLNMLRTSGYNGIISIEASVNDFEKDIYDSKKFIEGFYRVS